VILGRRRNLLILEARIIQFIVCSVRRRRRRSRRQQSVHNCLLVSELVARWVLLSVRFQLNCAKRNPSQLPHSVQGCQKMAARRTMLVK
jgi:hypothetical protein